MGNKVRKPIYKKWWFIIIVIALGIGMIEGVIGIIKGEVGNDKDTIEINDQNPVETVQVYNPEPIVDQDDHKDKENKPNSPKEVEKKDGKVELDLNIEEREFSVGKSDKNFLELTTTKPSSILNDVTKRWKKILIAESIDVNDYVLSYNKLYMDQDSSAVHVIFNFTYNTTTLINDFGSYIHVTTYEYVKKEEHDAKKIPSGIKLSEYEIYKDNGDIVDFEELIKDENN